MKSSSFIQIFIFIIIVGVSFFVYKNFFISGSYIDETQVENENKIQEINDSVKSDKNLILSLEYQSLDALGNKYIIKSKSAESESDNNDLLKLTDVNSIIYLVDKPPIYIYSKFATHDKITFNTKFYDNVKIVHSDLNVVSDNLDLIYDDNIVSLYNIKKAYNDNSELKADKIDFDILTKDLSINMYNKEDKIKIIYK